MNPITPIAPLSIDTSLSTDQASSTASIGKSFGTYMANAAQETVNTIKSGETAMIDGLSGKGSMQDAVNAVIAAEASLQTVMAIRDKAITAYNEILRMPI